MSEEPDAKPIPSKCEEEAIRPLVERERPIAKMAYRLIKIALCLLVLTIAFFIGDFCGWTRHALLQEKETTAYDTSAKIGVYVYDTEQKIEEFYSMLAKADSEATGLSPESPEIKQITAELRKQMRPLVAVGPFAVFVDSDGTSFSVCDISSKVEQGYLLPIVILKMNDDNSKRLCLYGSQGKERKLRFQSMLHYSEDGVYKKSVFIVHGDNEDRIYLDSTGDGFFEEMNVFENEVRYKYSLNGLTWELKDELPYPEKLKALKKERFLRPGE